MKKIKDVFFIIACFAVILSLFLPGLDKPSWPKWILGFANWFSIASFIGFLIIFFINRHHKKYEIISGQLINKRSLILKGFLWLIVSGVLLFSPMFLTSLICPNSQAFFFDCFLGNLALVGGLFMLAAFVFLALAISKFILFFKEKKKHKTDF